MKFVEDIAELEALYGTPGEASLQKVANGMTPAYRAWIARSKLCILSTVGPEGTDASPRGDNGPVVRELDPATLALPDWRGNNRMDSLRNIVRDPRISLMFFVAGSNNVIRVNGSARMSTDPKLLESFRNDKNIPRSVIVARISEVYSQCARALMRADHWGGADDTEGLPSLGDILREQTSGAFDGARYDRDWAARAKETMW